MTELCRLLVCKTCPRYEHTPAGQATRGRNLAGALHRRLSGDPLARSYRLRVVNCLAGCTRPCNFAIAGPGRERLRFSEITSDDVEAIVELAQIYLASPDGKLTDNLPDSLAPRLTARSPVGIDV